MSREPSTAADYAGIEAASEAAHHGDEPDDRPDPYDRDENFGATGPGPHTCTTDIAITCFPCMLGIPLPTADRGAA